MIGTAIDMSKILQEPSWKGYLPQAKGDSDQGRLPGGGDNPSRTFKESQEILMPRTKGLQAGG